MSVTALVCTIATGFGAVSSYPGMTQSDRYQDAVVTLKIESHVVVDVIVSGPIDFNYSYDAHNILLSTQRVEGYWIVTAKSPEPSADYLHETFVIADMGRFIWSQVANAPDIHSASAGVFSGQCQSSPP